MKQVLIFKTGETTCSENPAYPGSMCPFVYCTGLGPRPVCHLYGDALYNDAHGWLQRLPICIAEHHGIKDLSERG